MCASPVALSLVADELAARRTAVALFPASRRVLLGRADLRPDVPFRGRLFELLQRQPRGSLIGLVVPIRVVAGPAVPGVAIAVSDHINLTLRSPLYGRWPAGLRRRFPALVGLYQPGAIRARAHGWVYSAGVVAGVADAGRLTPFEAGVVRDVGCRAVSDTLIPAAIIAAYYEHRLAACGVPQVEHCDEERGVT